MTARANLSTEQRRALALLIRGERGFTEATLVRVHGFTTELLTSLVHKGLVRIAHGMARIGGRTIRIERIKITNVGRQAIDGAMNDWK